MQVKTTRKTYSGLEKLHLDSILFKNKHGEPEAKISPKGMGKIKWKQKGYK